MNATAGTSLPPTPWRVRIALFVAFAVFFSALAVIYYEFVVTPQTDCNIQIFGNKTLDQAVAEVELVGNTGDPQHYTEKFDPSNYYAARFFLSSGTYRVKVTKADGTVLVDTKTFIPPGFRQQYNLTAAPATKPKAIEP